MNDNLRTIRQALESLAPGKTRDGAIEALYDIQERHTRRTAILAKVKAAIEQLRVDVKYLVFDLEVTKRERDRLQEKLDKS